MRHTGPWCRSRLAALAVAAVALVPAARAQQLLRAWDGEAPGDLFGTGVAYAGDVDGDGRGDLLVGAPARNFQTGKVYAYSGRDGGLIRTWVGEELGDLLGFYVAQIGDVDGDRIDDLALGALFHDGPAGDDSGRLYVYSGGSFTLLWQNDGETALAHHGEYADYGGDLDMDGLNDVLVGSHGASSSGLFRNGKVYVYAGNTGALLHEWEGEGDMHGLGLDVSIAGDVDGDGVEDVLAGAKGYDGAEGDDVGKAYLYSGATGALIRSWVGEKPDDEFGRDVEGLLDVDGDGVADLAFGAFHFAGAAGAEQGKVYVYSGATDALLWSAVGEGAGDLFGEPIDRIRDVDGDGAMELVTSGRRHAGSGGPSSGRVYVYSGRDGTFLWSADGQAPGDAFGYGLSSVRTLTGPATDVLLAGAAQHDGPNGPNSGRVYAVRGPRP